MKTYETNNDLLLACSSGGTPSEQLDPSPVQLIFSLQIHLPTYAKLLETLTSSAANSVLVVAKRIQAANYYRGTKDQEGNTIGVE